MDIPGKDNSRSALARRGLHHCDIVGRFVNPKGGSVAGIRAQLAGTRPEELAAAGAIRRGDRP